MAEFIVISLLLMIGIELILNIPVLRVNSDFKKVLYLVVVIYFLMKSNYLLAGIITLVSFTVVKTVVKMVIFNKSTYHKNTHNSYFRTIFNAGRNGEYLVYKYLKKYEKSGAKFLFNVYVPRENNETTEIDVLMISTKGIFVFESKNYSGWIFGNENDYKWTQTFRNQHKEKFYNPIKQNNTHLKYLKITIGCDYPFHSIIAFSDRCVLKNVTVNSVDVCVVNRYNIPFIVKNIYGQTNKDALSSDEVEKIYSILYPFTQVDEVIKKQHIENIDKKSTSEQSSEPAKESNNTEPANQPEKDEKHICPKCGNELVLRQATRGNNAGKAFYGCSKFPKCRYIQEIKETTDNNI